jgi:hypothetical protein
MPKAYERQQCAVAPAGLDAEHPVHVGFGQDAFGEPVQEGRPPEHAVNVERQVRNPVSEASSEVLQIRHQDQGEGLPCPPAGAGPHRQGKLAAVWRKRPSSQRPISWSSLDPWGAT